MDNKSLCLDEHWKFHVYVLSCESIKCTKKRKIKILSDILCVAKYEKRIQNARRNKRNTQKKQTIT